MRRIECRIVCFIVVGFAFLCLEMSIHETVNTDGAVYGKHDEEKGSGDIEKDRFAVADGGIGVEPAYAAPEPISLSSSTPEDLDHGLERDQYEEGGEMVGETINILNGNMVDVRTDLSFPSAHRFGLRFEAVYNNRSDIPGKSGHGWTHTYEAAAVPGAAGSGYDLKISDGTGKSRYFVRDTGLGGYRGIYQERSHVILWRTHYIWVLADGSKYRFSTISGKLTSMEDPVGNTLDLGYDSQWRPVSVTDVSSQRMIGFKYNAQGLLQEIDGPVTAAVPAVPGEPYGVWVQYGYDSAGNLASVTYADGSGFTYQYQGSATDPHRLWRKLNKLGHLIDSRGTMTIRTSVLQG
jgi:YD repeat-containing protein